MLQSLMNFGLAHEGLLGALSVGILDLIFALKPNWQSSGILHFLLVQAQSLAGKNQQPPANPPAAQ